MSDKLDVAIRMLEDATLHTRSDQISLSVEVARLVYDAVKSAKQENTELRRIFDVKYITSLEDKCAELERIIAESQAQKPIGWRVKYHNVYAEHNHPFTNGAPSDQSINYWKENGAELEYCFASPVIREGMQLVPIEPTEKMLLAADNYMATADQWECYPIYKAMLNASKEG